MTILMTEALNSFLETLDPKTRKQFKLAQEVNKELLPSASLTWNYVMSGGFPRGAITTIHGGTSSGKTAAVLESIGKMQADGKICAFVDAENTYDKEWATRLGVDNDSLILIRRRSAGAIGDQLAPLIKANIDFIAIDSITAIMPENFVDDDGNLKEFDKRKQIGANSRALGILYNGFLYDIDRTAIALISQQRADLSGQHAMMRPSGGKATEFASSIILKLNSSNSESQQKMGRVYLGDKVHQFPVGREVKVYGEKNKIGPQSRTGSYLFYYSGDKVGIDHVDEAVTLGKMFGIVDSAGAWTRFGSEPYVTGINQWQGQPAFVNALNEDPELYAKLEKQLNEVML